MTFPSKLKVIFCNIKKMLEGYDIKVSKIASGVPIGAEIEYIDPMTLEFALEGRKDI